MNEAMQKIVCYKPGFRFTIHYGQVPEEKRASLRSLLDKAEKNGWIESVQIGLGWLDGFDGGLKVCDETFVRTAKVQEE